MKVNRIDIPNVSNNPTFSYCRWLIKQGADPEEYLEVYRNPDFNYYWDYRMKIGWGAKMRVKEDPYLRFVKSNPPPVLKGSTKHTGVLH